MIRLLILILIYFVIFISTIYCLRSFGSDEKSCENAISESGAHFEILTGIIRAGRTFRFYGDDFDFAATVIFEGDGVAHIKGAAGYFEKSFIQKMTKELWPLGIRTIHWERLKKGRKKIVVISLVDPSIEVNP